MAICDGNYKFIYIDTGCNGRILDGGVFNMCSFSAEELADRTVKSPYVIVGDDAIPLKPNMMKPFVGQPLPVSHRIFNYRLSRARRVIENAE